MEGTRVSVSGPGVGAERVRRLAPRPKAPKWSGGQCNSSGMVGLRNQSHHENTEGERVKPDQTARDSAYWLGRIMRALIVGFGSGNRLDQMGKVRCSAGPPQLQPQAGWGTAGLTLDAVFLLCRRLNKLVSDDVACCKRCYQGDTDKRRTDRHLGDYGSNQVITGDSGAMQRF